MILTGHEDLRVVKTIGGIKTAFEELICEKDYEKITVKELCDRARINKKTFYHYYETLDHLLAEMQGELSLGFIERIKNLKLPEELDKVNREFFLYAAEQGREVYVSEAGLPFPQGAGGLALTEQGAKSVTGPVDVMMDLGWEIEFPVYKTDSLKEAEQHQLLSWELDDKAVNNYGIYYFKK